MGTAVVETSIVVSLAPEILGPGSVYEERRIALKNNYAQIILEAKKITAINTPEEAEQANNFGRLLQAGTKDSEAFFKPVKQQCDAIKNPILAAEKEFAAPIEEEKKRLGELLTVYNNKVRKEREEEERKQREEAEKAARDEQLARAIELDEAGDKEQAAAVLEEPVFSPVVTQSQAPVKVSGQVGKVSYSAEIKNFKELIQAVIDGKAPQACVIADLSYLNKKAALEKEGFSVPGVDLKRTSSTHFRA